MAQGKSRVVVRSIGKSGVGLVRSLRQVMPMPEPDIAALLLQAPSALLTGLDRPTADAVARFLNETGLDCAALDADSPWEEGLGDHEIALHIHDFSRMSGIVLEVMGLLGVDANTANQLVCAVPAQLLGGVSAATVAALQARFAPLGASIDASCTDTARYDLFLGAKPGDLHERTLAKLRLLAGDAASGLVENSLLPGLDCALAQRIVQELRPLSVPLRVINRDFARYALILQQGSDSSAMRDSLARWAGMPASVIPQVLAHLPVVLHNSLKHEETAAALADLSAADASATVEPVALQRFSLDLEPVRDPAAVLPLLREIGGINETDALAVLRSRPSRLPGPFTATQARWLAYELKRVGVTARLESL
jgi:hypothetical protein